ncbi:hypothetical protein ACNEP6_23915 [Escherichia coli]
MARIIFHFSLVTLSVNNLTHSTKGSTGWWFSLPKAPHPQKQVFAGFFFINRELLRKIDFSYSLYDI